MPVRVLVVPGTASRDAALAEEHGHLTAARAARVAAECGCDGWC